MSQFHFVLGVSIDGLYTEICKNVYYIYSVFICKNLDIDMWNLIWLQNLPSQRGGSYKQPEIFIYIKFIYLSSIYYLSYDALQILQKNLILSKFSTLEYTHINKLSKNKVNFCLRKTQMVINIFRNTLIYSKFFLQQYDVTNEEWIFHFLLFLFSLFWLLFSIAFKLTPVLRNTGNRK